MSVINKIINPEEEPDVVANNIEVLFSDSARLQTKLQAPVFKQFSSASEKRREFPEGLHVWFYEKTGELKAEITANRAFQNITTEIWEANGNVVVIDSDGKKLETEQLFWDPQKKIVYNEKYTKITLKNGTMSSGEAFFAKQDFKKISMPNKSGVGKAVIYMEDEEGKTDENKLEEDKPKENKPEE